jgi:protein-tyrosine-phosphatase
MATVLFVCLHNAGRSQMSQSLFERAATGKHTALSAGTTPAKHAHPDVIQVMGELDIDISDRRPRLLTRELAEQADVVVTMGCGDQWKEGSPQSLIGASDAMAASMSTVAAARAGPAIVASRSILAASPPPS